ncbi:MAG: ribbon-helix-helix domain-containing protein [Ancrocorticia sp.]|uniref:ribbon-helix-helix domain-containing protein n=1 Tax=Ancrocorticia sp. TaxID=2593684 RepID=UPI003F9218D3
MSVQIAVRLPDHMVEALDAVVADGRAPSRAAVVTSAVERELRRMLAERDAEILHESGTGDDLDSVVQWTMEGFEPGTPSGSEECGTSAARQS